MIEFNDSLFRVENLEYLLFVGLGVGNDFLASQLLACFRLAGRIPDHAGEVADQKNHLMTEILKLFHLLDQHRVTQMQIRSCGIEAGLDFKRLASLKLGEEFFLWQDFDCAALD